MPTQSETAERFLALHHADSPLLIPNPWDAGSAKLLQSIGFSALATTSNGFAATQGKLDGSMTRDEAIANAAAIAAAVDLPVSADLENLYAQDPAGCAETVRLAIAAGLAGCSIEDYTGDPKAPLYDRSEAAERVSAAAEAAHSGPTRLVLTARAEGYLRAEPDLPDVIARLQDYSQAGADVLYAPVVTKPDELRELVASVDKPVNVLALPGVPTVAELAEIGVKRISVGGAFAFVAYNSLVEAGRELLDHGTYNYWNQAGPGSTAARAAFTP
jgi:2-methylisocitrate lyase-like PEP mutase family enzyme